MSNSREEMRLLLRRVREMQGSLRGNRQVLAALAGLAYRERAAGRGYLRNHSRYRDGPEPDFYGRFQHHNPYASLYLPGWITYQGTDPTANSLIAPIFDSVSGYAGFNLYHESSGTLVITSRGTEPPSGENQNNWADLWADAELFNEFVNPQLIDAVNYAADSVVYARARGINISEVIITGHSLGGGLAEAQVALLNAVLADMGEPPVIVSGQGVGSAAFGAMYSGDRSIFSNQEFLEWFPNLTEASIDPNFQSSFLHLVRSDDFIPNPFGIGTYLAPVEYIGNIYQTVERYFAYAGGPGPHGVAPGWGLGQDIGQSHSHILYTEFANLPADQHAILRLASGDTVILGEHYTLEAGATPSVWTTQLMTPDECPSSEHLAQLAA